MKSILNNLRNNFLFFLMLLLLANTSYGKNTLTILVVEKETGTPISFALITSGEKANNKPLGMTDLDGRFVIQNPEAGKKIVIKFIGFAANEIIIPADQKELTVELTKGIELKTLVISASKTPLISCGFGCSGYIVTNLCTLVCGSTLRTDSLDLNSSEILKTTSLNIYPNPSRGSIRINSGEENFLFEVFDCTGKLILKLENANDNESIDLTSFKAGVYFARITKDATNLTSRLVIN